MKKIIATIGFVALAGCATNGFKQFYHDETGGRDLTQLPVVIPTIEPRLIQGSDPKKDAQAMSEEGYILLGYSSFNGPSADQADAVRVAKAVHAEVVIVYSNYTHTVSGTMPIVTPTSQTSYSTANATAYGSNGTSATAHGSGTTTTYGSQTNYMPYSVARYDQGAQFWIKSKPPVLGVRVQDLTDEKRRELASNKGVEVMVVTKGSPAFNADFMRGDIIRTIDGLDVPLAKAFFEFTSSLAGRTVVIEGFRDGKSFKKTVLLNSKAL